MVNKYMYERTDLMTLRESLRIDLYRYHLFTWDDALVKLISIMVKHHLYELEILLCHCQELTIAVHFLYRSFSLPIDYMSWSFIDSTVEPLLSSLLSLFTFQH